VVKTFEQRQEVTGTNPSYDSVFDTAAWWDKLQASDIASPLMQLASREPGVNLIIIRQNDGKEGGVFRLLHE